MKEYYNKGFTFKGFRSIVDLDYFVRTNNINVISITYDSNLHQYILFYFEQK